MSQTVHPSARPVPSAKTPRRASGVKLLVLLGLLTGVGPLALDMYLPAFPELAHDLDASQSQVQLSLTTCLIGFAAGQLITGPLSDRWGRRRPVIIGVSAYTLFALLSAFAPTAEALAAIRLFQGFAGGMGLVVSRAVVRDLYQGRAAAKYFSQLTLIFGIAPVAAPGLGSLVLRFSDWRGTFVTLAVIGLLLLVALIRWLPETLPVERRHTAGLADTTRALRALITDRAFLGYALTQGMANAALFAYISGSSFAFQEVFGVSGGIYSLIFGLNALGLIAAGQVNARLLDRFPPRTLLTSMLVVYATAGVGVLIGAAVSSLFVVSLGLFVFISSLGMVTPNSTALALDRHPGHVGTAAAVLGGIVSVIGASAAPLVGLGDGSSAIPMGLVICCTTLLSLAALFTLTRSRRA